MEGFITFIQSLDQNLIMVVSFIVLQDRRMYIKQLDTIHNQGIRLCL